MDVPTSSMVAIMPKLISPLVNLLEATDNSRIGQLLVHLLSMWHIVRPGKISIDCKNYANFFKNSMVTTLSIGFAPYEFMNSSITKSNIIWKGISGYCTVNCWFLKMLSSLKWSSGREYTKPVICSLHEASCMQSMYLLFTHKCFSHASIL